MGRILFIRGGAVGDFILTMPSLKLVRESLPGNEIEILGYPSIASLALAAGLADQIRPLEDPKLATFFVPHAKLDPEWCSYFSGFDVVVSCLYDPDHYFADNLVNSGVETLITCPYRPVETIPLIPAARQFAQPLESLGLFLDDAGLAIPYPDHPDAIPLSKAASRIAIHPGSGSPKKNWGYENWVEVLTTLHREHEDRRFLVTSGEAEAETIIDFLHLLDQRAIPYDHLFGRSLAELASHYRRIDGFLGHDSGLSHLAASTGAKALLLFGPTEPGIWAPVSQSVEIIHSVDRSLAGIRIDEVARRASDLFTA